MRSRNILAFAVTAACLGSACSADEYTASNARTDLQKLGYSSAQAACILDGLNTHYAAEYIKLNTQQIVDAQKHDATIVASLNPKAVALYVRNVFAGSDEVGNDEKAFAQLLTTRCRSTARA